MAESHHRRFFRAFLRNAGQVGAVAPSSPELARLMVDWIDWEGVTAAVEFGPGTGVFTEEISRRLPTKADFFAVERDPDLAATTRERLPDVEIVESCVSEVPTLCRERGIDRVDVVLSGLPWAAFPSELQDRLLDAMFEVLPPGGRFATFAYWQGMALPAAQRFRRTLQERFATVERSPTAWRNLPPAFVYRCVR